MKANKHSYQPGRWVTPDEIANHYGITRAHLRKLTGRGAWPCHRYGRLTRFSPGDQATIEAKWREYKGNDPAVSDPRWRELAMQENLTAEERDAVERGYEASKYLRSLES